MQSTVRVLLGSLLVVAAFLAWQPGSASAFEIYNDSCNTITVEVDPGNFEQTIPGSCGGPQQHEGCHYSNEGCNPDGTRHSLLRANIRGPHNFQCFVDLRGGGYVNVAGYSHIDPKWGVPEKLQCVSRYETTAGDYDTTQTTGVDPAWASQPVEQPARFLTIADPQYGHHGCDDWVCPDGSDNDEDGVQDNVEADRVLTHLRDEMYSGDYHGIVVAGDMTGTPQNRSSEYDRYLAHFAGNLRYVFDGLGNHDDDSRSLRKHVWDASRTTAYTERGEDEDEPHYSWDWNNVHFVQLNLAPSDADDDSNDPRDALTFLEEDLRDHVGDSGRPVVLIQHYGFDDFSIGQVEDGFEWWTADERQQFWDAIQGYDIAAIFHGHNHIDVNTAGWWHFLCDPSTTTHRSGRCTTGAIPVFNAATAAKGVFLDTVVEADGDLTVHRMERTTDGVRRQATAQIPDKPPVVSLRAFEREDDGSPGTEVGDEGVTGRAIVVKASAEDLDLSELHLKVDGAFVARRTTSTTPKIQSPLTEVEHVVEAEGRHELVLEGVDRFNKRTTHELTVSIDNNAPFMTIGTDPAPNASGWHRTDVQTRATATDTDALTSFRSCLFPLGLCRTETGATTPPFDTALDAPVLTADEEGISTFVAEATDRRGFVSTLVVPIRIDKFAPDVHHSHDAPVASPAGWHRTDVVAHFRCTDNMSGPEQERVVSAAVTGEGRSLPATATCRDRAGNERGGTRPVFIDRSPPHAPRIVVERDPEDDRPGDAEDWWADQVVVRTFQEGDPPLADGSQGSLVDQSTVTADETVRASRTVRRSVRDRATNASPVTERRINVDATSPSLVAAGCPGAVVARGATQILTVTAGDGQSGLEDDPSGTMTLDTRTPGAHTVTVTATDRVGHVTTETCAYRVNAPPSAPGAPVADDAVNAGAFGLAWTAAQDGDGNLQGYVLEHRDADDAAYSVAVDSLLADPQHEFGGEAEGTWTYRVQAQDALGELVVSPESDPVKVDRTAPRRPAVSPSRAPEADGGADGTSWYRDAVVVTFAADGDPELVDGSPGSGVVASSVPGAEAFGTSGSHTATGRVSDAAGNVSEPASLTVHVDADAPGLGTDGCPAGPVSLGSRHVVTVTATDPHSGLAADPSGAHPLDTGRVGRRSVTFDARDRVGHVTTRTCEYEVHYEFAGFDGLAAPPATNGTWAGSLMTLSFALKGQRSTSVMATGYPQTRRLACGSTERFTTGEPVGGALRLFVYDGLRQRYRYTWQSDASWRGTCRQFVLKLDDGSYHRVNLRFM